MDGCGSVFWRCGCHHHRCGPRPRRTQRGHRPWYYSLNVPDPGGDLIRELIGAFPSLVLAEGEYVVIARHDAKTYQSTFQVQSGLDRDVEVIAQ